MPAIFISHSSLDQQIANDIKTALDQFGFEQVFLDFDKVTGIDAGENWEKRLYEELSRCHAVILVLTPNWLASKWCFAELTQARALGKVILPIVCKPLGERFVLPEIQSVDLLDWNAGGLDKLEQRLRAITNEPARGFKLDPNRSPFPGIHAFEAEDAAIYFGRDDETRAVIERLDARRTQGGARFLVIIGASGSGKSSLLKAGVLPQLSRRRREWVALPYIRPEKAPIETLAKSIAQQIGKPDDWRVWQAMLGSAVAIDHVEKLLRDIRVGDARGATVLLPIDQFEEVFTVATPAERATFLHLLASAVDPARDLPVMVIATGRSDVLEGLLEAVELAHLTETYALMPMPLDRVPRLVEGPAQVAGLNVEKGLAEAIARDVESAEALPLLAHTLWLLCRRCSDNKKLSLAEYRSLGDPERHLNPIQNSVRLVADQAIGGLKPADAELAALRDAFVPHLVRVRLDDGKRVRQPARLSELPREALRVIRALVEARLLSTRATGETDGSAKHGGEAVVEVTHEALFKAWPTLDQWLTEEHTFLSDIERIKSAHDIWTQAPDAQKARALLGGLLLSRARDWLLKYPQRFLSRDTAALRAFIDQSTKRESMTRGRARRVRALVYVLLVGIIAGLVGWINQSYIKEEINWFMTMRPYMVKQVRPFVRSAEAERSLKPRETFRECAKDCPEMIVVPAGEFMMGSPVNEKGRSINEGPQHSVTIARPFAVSKFDVTFADWDACVSVGGCPREGGANDNGWGRLDRPVINLNWDDAQAYVAWLRKMTGKEYRLLSEAEWEYAARAGTTTAFYWGDEIDKENANCHSCENEWSKLRTSPVGSFKANPFGLYDMAGNVWQWVQDCWHEDYNGAPTDGFVAWTTGDCEKRVVRGGSWYYYPADPRSAYRYGDKKDDRNYNTGFRVARTLTP